jgi:hypothetical protein
MLESPENSVAIKVTQWHICRDSDRQRQILPVGLIEALECWIESLRASTTMGVYR